jgi:hypothetical protein
LRWSEPKGNERKKKRKGIAQILGIFIEHTKKLENIVRKEEINTSPSSCIVKKLIQRHNWLLLQENSFLSSVELE